MVSKKGEGVRGVLGDLVSRDKAQPEHPRPQSAPERPEKPEPATPPENAAGPSQADRHPADPPRKATGIKGRPRGRGGDAAAPRGRTKVTLSIDEMLRDQFYRLAHAEMIQPGEFVERALRYYIQHHPK